MPNTVTTDNQRLTLTWSKVIPVVIAIVFSSNALTAYKYQIDENTQETIYERERTDRKFKNNMIETKQLLHIQSLENEIIMLDLKLEECENNN